MILLNFYKNRFKKYGVDPKSLVWKTRGAAHQRFRQFWSEIDFTKKSILDVGCGFGEFGNFLAKRYKDVRYKGVDIVPEFIVNGKKMYPHLTLITADYFNQPLPETFDVIICSGALNSNFGSKNKNMNFRRSAIKTMFKHTTNVFAFNMSGSFPQQKNKNINIWYADSLEILKYCLSLTNRVIMRHNYHSKDFTVFMYKQSLPLIGTVSDK